MKRLMKEFLNRGNKLLNELWKRQVSRPYLAQENSFKRKLEGCKSRRGKFTTGITVESGNLKNMTYEPVRISNIYNSLIWRWRRVKEYLEEIESEIVFDKGFKEARTIMNS